MTYSRQVKKEYYYAKRENRYPPAPASLLKNAFTINIKEREYIEKYCKDYSASAIAEKLQRGKNIIIVEIRRNGGAENYNAAAAHKAAQLRIKQRSQKYCASAEEQVKIVSRWREGESIYKMSENMEIGYGEIQRVIIDHTFLKSEKERRLLLQHVAFLEKRIQALETFAFGSSKVSKGSKKKDLLSDQ
jgi:IS30 family transposase